MLKEYFPLYVISSILDHLLSTADANDRVGTPVFEVMDLQGAQLAEPRLCLLRKITDAFIHAGADDDEIFGDIGAEAVDEVVEAFRILVRVEYFCEHNDAFERVEDHHVQASVMARFICFHFDLKSVQGDSGKIAPVKAR